MKRVSTAIMFIGIAMLIWALGNDVSVEGMRGSRVINSGLMHDRLVNIILSLAVALCGLLLKIFGAHLNTGYWHAIDQLPRAEYFARIVTILAASACVWVLVPMILWPSTLVGILILTAIGWCAFLPKPSYMVLKWIWLTVLLLAVGLLAFHVISIQTNWVNMLTYFLIDKGVGIVGTGKLNPILAVLVGVPMLVSMAGYAITTIKSRKR